MRLHVGVEDVNVESLAGLCVNDRTGNSAIGRGLVDVGCDERIGLQDGVARIEVFSIHQSLQPASLDFGSGYIPILMIHIAHAIDAVFVMFSIVGSHRAVVVQWLDFQIDMSFVHGLPSLPSKIERPAIETRLMVITHSGYLILRKIPSSENP